MRFELSQSLGAVTEEERTRLLRAMLLPLAETMLLVCGQYGLIENPDNQGWVITNLGQRVVAHLFDAYRFIDSVVAAHTRLQTELK